MKKTLKVSGSNGGFKAVASRKKKKRDVLEKSVDNSGVAAKALGARSWGSETGDTTESKSIDMKEKCLVEKTSVDYGESGTFTEGDPNQMSKSLHVKTKKVLRKPLGVIDYNTVNAGVNGFGGASTFSKFDGIIYATFTSEEMMMAAAKLANDCGVMVNTDLKCPSNNYTNRAIVLKKIPVETFVEAVCVAVSKFGVIKMIKMQLVGLWQKAIVKLED
ncbi:hypothetical protein G9A89_015578 [Geosiphon pyriformis]|nr:hypothetical protein G9A89_015578 [Geosiphon pyriformis]